jgi:hypothetical protein
MMFSLLGEIIYMSILLLIALTSNISIIITTIYAVNVFFVILLVCVWSLVMFMKKMVIIMEPARGL